MVLQKTTGMALFVDYPIAINGEVPHLLSIKHSLWLGDILHISMLLVTIGLAILTYRYIEEPGRLWSRRYATRTPVQRSVVEA